MTCNRQESSQFPHRCADFHPGNDRQGTAEGEIGIYGLREQKSTGFPQTLLLARGFGAHPTAPWMLTTQFIKKKWGHYYIAKNQGANKPPATAGLRLT